MLSHTAEYALRAALYLAEHGQGRLVQVGEMAEALHIPRNYLSKILHMLVRHGVLRSTRGKAGGFQLAKTANELHLVHVVAPFGSLGEKRQCLLGRPQCSDRTACAAHDRWKELADRMVVFFRETTLAELLGGAVIAA